MEELDVPNSDFVRNAMDPFVGPNDSFLFVIAANIVPGTILLPIGLLITGWATQERVFWLVPDIVSDLDCCAPNGSAEGYKQGIALVGAGTIVTFYSIQAYLIDAFTLHAASGMNICLTHIGFCALTHYHSPCGCYVLALFGRLRISVICSDDVQCTGIRQG